MEKANKKFEKKKVTRVAAALAAGTVAVGLVACDNNSESGGSAFGGGLGSSNEIPYGAECLDHPENWDAHKPREERGIGIDGAGGSFESLIEEGYLNEDGVPTDFMIDLKTLAHVNVRLGDPDGQWSRADAQEEALRESYRQLLENFDQERYHMDVMQKPGDELPRPAVHAYGDGGRPDSSETGEYKLCFSWDEPEYNDEYVSY